MKKIIYTLLLAVSFFACSDDDTSYSIAPELEAYVNTFIAEAGERGVTVPQNLIAEVSHKAQSIANASIEGNQNYLYVTNTIPTTAISVELNVYNALGELFVKNRVVIDYATYEKEAFFDDLIK
jgi:hypothetical protein